MHPVARLSRNGLVRGMGCERRHRPACRRHTVEPGERHLVGRDATRRGDAVQHTVSCRPCRSMRAIRPPRFRRLRQRNQQCGLRHGQPARLLAEVGQRSSPDALEVAAIGRKAQIQPEDFVLGQLALELDGPDHLAQLRGERPLGARLQQTRNLHGDGRPARDDPAVGDELKRRPRHRQRIDAGMRPEAAILVGQQHLDKAAVDLGRGGWKPPAALRRRVGPQQLPVTIQHHRRVCQRIAARNRPERTDPRGADRRDGHDRRSNTADDGCRQPHRTTWPISRSTRCRCARTDPGGTCPRRRLAAARSGRATPRARHRPP